MSDPILLVTFAVFKKPGLTGREISDNLCRDGHIISKREVNQILYSKQRIFWHTVNHNLKPSWYLHDCVEVIINGAIEAFKIEEADISIADSMYMDFSGAYPDYLNLYPWQNKALDKWADAGYVGVIEAVTGTGKTRVALAAIEGHFHKSWKVAIIVPTIELQDQWYKVIASDLIIPSGLKIRVGRLGNGHTDSLDYYDVLVATSSSACNRRLHNGKYNGLLIADECHRYGADNWSRVLEERFTRRLGLTATYERDDGGIEFHLNPYFKAVCYTLGYDEALSDGVIANFKIAFIGYEFNNAEREEYEKYNKDCISYKNSLITKFSVTAEPFGEFMKIVTHLSRGGEGLATALARGYLSSFNKRRQLLSNCDSKKNCLAELVPSMEKADRVIIFTQFKEAASNVVEVLRRIGVSAEMLDATLHREERKNALNGFEDGTCKVIVAPKLLDEGIDVPAADLAIVIASSRSKRQMIQRMGRVLRKKVDGRLARIAIFYIKGTSEDPACGAHETYIDLIRDSAEDVKFFSIGEQESICRYLNDWGNNFTFGAETMTDEHYFTFTHSLCNKMKGRG